MTSLTMEAKLRDAEQWVESLIDTCNMIAAPGCAHASRQYQEILKIFQEFRRYDRAADIVNYWHGRGKPVSFEAAMLAVTHTQETEQ